MLWPCLAALAIALAAFLTRGRRARSVATISWSSARAGCAAAAILGLLLRLLLLPIGPYLHWVVGVGWACPARPLCLRALRHARKRHYFALLAFQCCGDLAADSLGYGLHRIIADARR